MLKKLKGLKSLATPKLLLLPLLILSCLYVVAATPQMHKDYIRSSVGEHVYRIVQNSEANSGGTGFSVQAPSGKNYILTNAHICDMYKGKSEALVELHDGRLIPRKIIEISQYTDLCLIEGLPGASGGLKLASGVEAGEDIMIVGHPRLMNLTISKGEVIEEAYPQIFNGMIGPDLTEEQCASQGKNEVLEVNSMFGPVKICITTIRALQTNAVSLGGNSGSPVVNFYGNVVGVLFASDDDVNWGFIVPGDDAADFLSAY